MRTPWYKLACPRCYDLREKKEWGKLPPGLVKYAHYDPDYWGAINTENDPLVVVEGRPPRPSRGPPPLATDPFPRTQILTSYQAGVSL